MYIAIYENLYDTFVKRNILNGEGYELIPKGHDSMNIILGYWFSEE